MPTVREEHPELYNFIDNATEEEKADFFGDFALRLQEMKKASDQTIRVEKVLTEDEFYCLEEEYPDMTEDYKWITYDPPKPGYYDDNFDEWVKFWYSKGYRMVKLYDSSNSTKIEGDE